MKRRDFITLLGGVAAWPLGASAQQPAMPVVGFLYGGTLTDVPHYVTAFRQGLKEAGWPDFSMAHPPGNMHMSSVLFARA